MKKNKVIIILDIFLPKNKIQEDILMHLGYDAFWLQTNVGKQFTEDSQHIVLPKNWLSRLIYLFFTIFKNRSSIHHAEVYTGGRMVFVWILLLKLFRIPVICVERGDVFYYFTKKMGFLTEFSMRNSYKLSNIIWYKEVYMHNILMKLVPEKKKVFIHNAVDLPHLDNETQIKDIDFLWVNRVLPERHPDWFSNALLDTSLASSTGNILGFPTNTEGAVLWQDLIPQCPSNLNPLAYQNPFSYFKRSRFFILPGEVVFGNHALMEAMAHGLVPIVLQSPGIELMVKHGVNGFVCSDYSSFLLCMKQAFAMHDDQYNLMSKENIKIIRKEFSYDYLHSNLKSLYEMV